MKDEDDLRRFRFALDANLSAARRLLAYELADALESEFGHILRGGSGKESWLKAANGIIGKMGLDIAAWIDANSIPYLLANFPVSAERRPVFAINKEPNNFNAFLSRGPIHPSPGDQAGS